MTKEQELKLFGSVEPTEESTFIEVANYLGVSLHSVCYFGVEELESLLELARTQREAIGALIEIVIGIEEVFTYSGLSDKKLILSVVLQDTWEQVREAWEENE